MSVTAKLKYLFEVLHKIYTVITINVLFSVMILKEPV